MSFSASGIRRQREQHLPERPRLLHRARRARRPRAHVVGHDLAALPPDEDHEEDGERQLRHAGRRDGPARQHDGQAVRVDDAGQKVGVRALCAAENTLNNISMQNVIDWMRVCML